jgi:hypothetical protein
VGAANAEQMESYQELVAALARVSISAGQSALITNKLAQKRERYGISDEQHKEMLANAFKNESKSKAMSSAVKPVGVGGGGERESDSESMAVIERGAAIHATGFPTGDIDFEMLRKATRGFHASLQIGDGGSCTVFKAKIHGFDCAIKMLSQEAGGWDAKQFHNEVALLSRVQHRNICRLFACSTNGPQQCLVLELMDAALDRRLVTAPQLGWEQRLLIALHICRSLVHLHSLSPPMIHRGSSC